MLSSAYMDFLYIFLGGGGGGGLHPPKILGRPPPSKNSVEFLQHKLLKNHQNC
jgi:hypothetical protein